MKLSDLKKLAEAATPGNWEYAGTEENISGMGHFIDARPLGPSVGQSEKQAEADAVFIAACNPKTVLQLIEKLEKAEEALKRMSVESFCDPQPTNGHHRDWRWWQNYLSDAIRIRCEVARQALAELRGELK